MQCTIDRKMAVEPGKLFVYNSGATQLLAHIFRKATGRDIEEYAMEHLFAPLGIDRYYWKRTPTGLIDTEGGLYLTPRDLAKLGYLYLQDGVWEGKRMVESVFVKASITASIDVGRGGQKYGYKWWLRPYGKDGRMSFGAVRALEGRCRSWCLRWTWCWCSPVGTYYLGGRA